MANRYVELNPDPQTRSDRPEWCYVRYDHTYHPLRAFQFELQWMVTTIEIFHQLVSKSLLLVSNMVAAPLTLKQLCNNRLYLTLSLSLHLSCAHTHTCTQTHTHTDSKLDTQGQHVWVHSCSCSNVTKSLPVQSWLSSSISSPTLYSP